MTFRSTSGAASLSLWKRSDSLLIKTIFRSSRGRRFGAVLVLCFCAATGLFAESYFIHNPNHAAIFLRVYDPKAQPVQPLERGQWEFNPTYTLSSLYFSGQHEDTFLIQAYELHSLNFSIRRGITDRLTLDLEARSFTTAQNRIRKIGHKEQLTLNTSQFIYQGEIVSQNDSGTSAGDTALGLSFRILQEQGLRPATALRLAAELPTGKQSRGFSNGSVDLAAVLGCEWGGSKNQGFSLRSFLVHPGSLTGAPGFPVRTYYGFDAQGHVRIPFSFLHDRWTAAGGMFWNSPSASARINIDHLSDPAFGLSGSLFYDATSKIQMEFTFSEDLFRTALAVPDFSVTAGFRYRTTP